MPRRLNAFPDVLAIKEYQDRIDKYLASTFDGEIWEFTDQEIQDLRVRLKLRSSRTRYTYLAWFDHAVKESAKRVGLEVRTKRTPQGMAIQVIGAK